MSQANQAQHANSPQALRRTAAYYLLFVGLGLSSAVLGPTLPMLAEQTHSRVGAMGLLFSATSLGYTVGTLLGGRLYDRLRGHPILGAAQVTAGLLLLLVPAAPALWMLACILAVKGFTDGLVNTGVHTLLMWTHGERVGPFMNGLHFSFGLGAFLSPLLVAQAVSFHVDYGWAFRALAVFNLLGGLVTLLLRGQPTAPQQPARVSPETSRSDALWIAVAALFLFFYVGAEIAFGGWLYTYTTSLELAGPAAAAYLTSAFWLAFTVGRLLAIAAATRFAPRRVVLVALLGCLGFLGLLFAVPWSPSALWVAAIGLGFCMAPIYPTAFTMVGQMIRLNARTTSLVLLGDSLGALLLPWLVGQVLDATGPQALVYLVTASLVCNLVAFGGLQWKSRAEQAR